MPILSAYVTATAAITYVRFHFNKDKKKTLKGVAMSVTTRPFLDCAVTVTDKEIPVDTLPNAGDIHKVYTLETMGLYNTGEGVWSGPCNAPFRALVLIDVYGTVAGDVVRVDINYLEEEE